MPLITDIEQPKPTPAQMQAQGIALRILAINVVFFAGILATIKFFG